MMMLSCPTLDITDVNEAAIAQYGFSKETFLKRNIKDIQVEEGLLDIQNCIKEDVNGYQDAGVWQHRKMNNEIITVEIFVSRMMIDGLKTKLVLAHDITEKAAAEKKQTAYLEQIRMLTGYLQEIREAERKNIAREIHDELGQQLTALKMEIAWIIKKLTANEKDIEHKFANLLATIDDTMTAVRRICAELRPTVLDDIGLEPAMEWHIQQFRQTTGIKVTMSSATKNLSLSTDIKTALFRIFQESLTNVARHANANTIEVSLNKENDCIALRIVDNGKGFDMAIADQKKTLGILGMKERCIALGGAYEINSKPGKGTTIKVCIPLMLSKEKSDMLNTKTG
jgi:PAS domain S-box-containing protein